MAASFSTGGTASAWLGRVKDASASQYDVLPSIRFGIALAALLLVFVGFQPFVDISTAAALEVVEGSEAATYFALLALVVAAFMFLPAGATRALRSLLRPVNLMIFAWLLLAVMVAPDRFASLKRLFLSLAVFALAAMIPLLMGSLRGLARVLLIGALVVICLSYLGVLLAPEYAIHQARDAVEPHLAGDWRGIYGHKNVTAAVMAGFVIVGFFCIRSGMIFFGGAAMIAALGFLAASHGKSATGLIFVAFALGWMASGRRSLWAKVCIALLPLALLNFLSVGSVVSEGARAVLGLLPIDTTFTGRTEIWEFAIASIVDRPVTGYGYQAFWGSEIVRSQSDKGADWAVLAATSHNSYVDLALTIGLPGLLFIVIGFIVLPLVDYHHTRREGGNAALADFGLFLWLFSIYFGSFEAIIFARAEPAWFTLALSVCILRYARLFRVTA